MSCKEKKSHVATGMGCISLYVGDLEIIIDNHDEVMNSLDDIVFDHNAVTFFSLEDCIVSTR